MTGSRRSKRNAVVVGYNRHDTTHHQQLHSRRSSRQSVSHDGLAIADSTSKSVCVQKQECVTSSARLCIVAERLEGFDSDCEYRNNSDRYHRVSIWGYSKSPNQPSDRSLLTQLTQKASFGMEMCLADARPVELLP